VNRYLLTLLSLSAVVIWLVLSYARPTWAPLATIAYPALWAALGLVLSLLALALFLVVQSIILWSTSRIKPEPIGEPPAGGRRMRVTTELFWTILPLLMTLGLACISYPTWRSLLAK
jgi:heme/copper-type cytochrome/quinol oxidase subunit 2